MICFIELLAYHKKIDKLFEIILSNSPAKVELGRNSEKYAQYCRHFETEDKNIFTLKSLRVCTNFTPIGRGVDRYC